MCWNERTLIDMRSVEISKPMGILLPVTLFVLSILYNFSLIKSPVGVLDEGIILAGAQRVSNGEFPVADFWDLYPPGQYLVVSALFSVFGESVLTERLYDIVIRSFLALVVYLSVLHIASSYRNALLGWFVVLVCIGSIEFSGYPVYPALVFAVLCGYYMSRYIESKRLIYVVAAGACIAISSVFRHDIGCMFCVTLFVVTLVQLIVNKERLVSPILCLISGAVPIIAMISLKWTSVADIDSIVNQMVFYPAALMPTYRWLPYPALDSIEALPFYSYPLVLVIGIIVSMAAVCRRKLTGKLRYGVLLFSAVGLVFMKVASVRSDYVHLVPVIIVAAIVGGLMLSSDVVDYVSAGIVRMKRSYTCGIIVLLVGPAVFSLVNKFKTLDASYFCLNSYTNRASFSRLSDDLSSVVMHVKNGCRESEYIYVGVTNHDRFMGNETIIYFLSDRRYATRYHQLHPGFSSLPEIQDEIIFELESNRPKFAVLSPMFWYEPNLSQVDMGVDTVDDYIHRNYYLCAQYGRYEVWSRLNDCGSDEY